MNTCELQQPDLLISCPNGNRLDSNGCVENCQCGTYIIINTEIVLYLLLFLVKEFDFYIGMVRKLTMKTSSGNKMYFYNISIVFLGDFWKCLTVM